MLTKGKNESINNNNKHEVQDGNDKNTTCNHRIEHTTTTTIDNSCFTTKRTLDNLSEKQNLVINPSKVHQSIFEAIKQIYETAAIITHNKIRLTISNTFSTDEDAKHASQTKDYAKSQKECTSHSFWNLHSLFLN